MRLVYQALQADDGHRAVDVLVLRTGMSRLMSKKIRLYGQLTCNGKPHRMVDPVRAGDFLVAIYHASPDQPDALKEVPGVQKRYLDDWLLVVSKPAGMVTHPTYLHETGSLTSSLADYPLHPITRLDRDTSGLVLIARNGHAHHVISSHPMKKQYIGVVHGRFPAPDGLIQAPIGRSADSIMLRKIDMMGSPAKTIWHEIFYFKYSNVSFVRFELLTGRTHQIRVHCKASGCPLIGDWLYGYTEVDDADPDIKSIDQLIHRQALHAASLQFRHPLTGETIHLTAPLPDDFRDLLKRLFMRERGFA